MSTYIIDFTDPLKPGFTIAPGSFNGPGGTNADTTLRLYGRGALEWGEAVNEDLARVTENFASATSPLNPIFGQMWIRQKLYIQNDSIVLTNGVDAPVNAFHRYRFEDDAWYTSGDPSFPFEVFVYAGTIIAFGAGTVIGEYTFSVADDILYRWDTPYGQAAPQWMARSRTHLTASNPIDGVTKPVQAMLIWQPADNTADGEWSGPAVATVADTAPIDPSISMYWWDTTTDTLYVWDGAAWSGVIVSGIDAVGNIDMGGFEVLGLPATPSATGAASKEYVDSLASTSVLDLLYLRLDGTNTPTAALTMGGFNLLNLPAQAYPIGSNNNAASITYVNGLATAIGTPGDGGFASVYTTGTPTHKIGDMYLEFVTGFFRIWIAITAATSAPLGSAANPGAASSDANWNHVFPAQYS